MTHNTHRKRKTFSCPGVLKGMGHQAECVVMGTRETVGEQKPRLIRLNVTREPAYLLDGLYVVTFADQSTRVQRRGGLWLWLDGGSNRA